MFPTSPPAGTYVSGFAGPEGRRRFVAGSLGAFLLPVAAPLAQASPLAAVNASVPGPGSSVSLPFELAIGIGADRDEGVRLRLKFVDGGGLAAADVASGISDFAAFGLPAAMEANLAGGSLVALAAVDDLPLYALMVCAKLKRKVRRVEDLRGLTIGVFSGSLKNKTTSQQVCELLLARHGLSPKEVNFLAAGQSWESLSAAVRSRSVDALMCDEPYGMQLEAAGLAYTLFKLGRPADAASLPGGGFLRAALLSRRDLVARDPALAERMVRVVARTLAWMRARGAPAVASALDMTGQRRQLFIEAARQFPRQYSADGRFSGAQLGETDRFFRALNPDDQRRQAFSAESMVEARWAGRKT